MPRQANGTYLAPANTAAISGQSISSTAFNTLETDIGTEITNSVDRGGRSAMTAPLPMGGQKITGMADPTVSTDGATKNYVDTTTAAFFSTGDVKPTYKTVADSGWVMMNDATIGNTGSGASSTGAAYLALYTLFWNNISSPSSNVFCAVTGGIGASASADWAGLKSMTLPKTVGRALAISGAGAGLTARTLGQTTGLETVTLGVGNLPAYTPAGTITLSPGLLPATNISSVSLTLGNGGSTTTHTWVIADGGGTGAPISSIPFVGTAQGGTSTPVSIMQPTAFMNAMVKL